MKISLLAGVALSCVLLFGGCGGSSLNPPSWYGKSAQDSSTLMGFGSAGSLESAKARALSDIITQMKVEVSSQYSSTTARENASLTHSSRSDVYLDSTGIELSDVRYVKDEFHNNQYYVAAQIPKSSLITQFKKSFEKEYNALNVAKLSQCQALTIKDKVRLESTLASLHSYASFLQALGSSTRSLSSLESLLSQNSPLPSARLVIESNMPNEILNADLAKELGAFYSFESGASNLIRVKLQLSGGGNSVKINATMSVLDCRNNPVYTTSVSYAHSASSADEALRFASTRISVQLYKKLQEWIEQ